MDYMHLLPLTDQQARSLARLLDEPDDSPDGINAEAVRKKLIEDMNFYEGSEDENQFRFAYREIRGKAAQIKALAADLDDHVGLDLNPPELKALARVMLTTLSGSIEVGVTHLRWRYGERPNGRQGDMLYRVN